MYFKVVATAAVVLIMVAVVVVVVVKVAVFINSISNTKSSTIQSQLSSCIHTVSNYSNELKCTQHCT